MNTPLGSYVELIEGFLDAGYKAAAFRALDGSQQLLLRHDVDFDCKLAYEMSLIEDQLGVVATYFFLVSSQSYNLFSTENAALVRDIAARGHEITIHFDSSVYPNPPEGLLIERSIFELAFGTNIDIVSFHKPTNDVINNNRIASLEHTYQDKYFSNTKYVSDSQGVFRFGHPFETKEFQQGRPIHLLIHPIWWVVNGADAVEVLEQHLSTRALDHRVHTGHLCTPFGGYLGLTR